MADVRLRGADRAEDLMANGAVVALKRVKMEKFADIEGFPMTVLREIQLLKQLRHENIVGLQDVVVGRTRDRWSASTARCFCLERTLTSLRATGRVFLQFEYCEHDLATLLDQMKHRFAESEIKCLLLQLLKALSFMHEHWVIHR